MCGLSQKLLGTIKGTKVSLNCCPIVYRYRYTMITTIKGNLVPFAASSSVYIYIL